MRTTRGRYELLWPDSSAPRPVVQLALLGALLGSVLVLHAAGRKLPWEGIAARDAILTHHCKALWDAKEARHTSQLSARRRVVLAQCPATDTPGTSRHQRCALPLAHKARTTGDEIDLRGMHVRAAWNAYEPEWVCESEERLGALLERTKDTGPIAIAVERRAAFGDGPKWVCGLDVLAVNRSCLVYSIGSHNDYGFEMAVKTVHPHCEIHTFDPTLGMVPGDGGATFLGATYSQFHDVGLGEQPGLGATDREAWRRKLRPLLDIMGELGHAGRTIDILKIDCESCEWTALKPAFAALAEGRLRIGQLQIEMHLVKKTSQDDIDRFMDAADRAGLRVFHKEPNVLHGNGFSSIEFAFVHRDFACSEFVLSHCPSVSRTRVCEG